MFKGTRVVSLRTVSGKALRRWCFALLVLAPTAVVFAVMPQDSVLTTEARVSDSKRCVPSQSNNWCGPRDAPAVVREVARQQARGMACSATPALTDVIVFQTRSLAVRVVTFDEAERLGRSGEGWVQAYCLAVEGPR